MRILHVSTLANGGAFNAALRLHIALLESGQDSTMITLRAHKKIQKVQVFPKWRYLKSRLGLTLSKRLEVKYAADKKRTIDRKVLDYNLEMFSAPFSDFKLGQYIEDQNHKYDVVHLHWVANFLDYQEFFSQVKVPVIWTLHDEAPYSSFYHYSNDYKPNEKISKLHSSYLRIKEDAIHGFSYPLMIVAPSEWLLNRSSSSSVFKNLQHFHIPYGVPVNVFKPVTQTVLNASLKGISDKCTKLMFICDYIQNHRKGLDILLEAMTFLDHGKFQLIAVGESDENMRKLLPGNTLFLGRIKENAELNMVYNACDFMVIPSRQDNLPNTLIESLCCGTPVIGTPSGGIFEVLRNPLFGVASSDFTPSSLASAINIAQSKQASFQRIKIAKEASKQFLPEVQSKRYIELYRQIAIN